ncbi:MAG TPA: OmpH family outer membrane protein [Bacteroidota bacterium]|nr:OmpH family outer membrane protein [Bacteroidota bacterium]
MRTFISTVTAVCLVAAVGFAQSKIAYVNSQKILEELPEAQKAQKELDDLLKGWQDELEKMGKELQQGLEDYQKKKDLLKPDAKEAEERRLTDIQQKAREYQAQKFDPRTGEAVSAREKKLAPIREKVLRAIEVVAKEDGFTFVFDKAGDNLLLFADAKFELTYKVIDRLKRGGSTPKSSK